MRWRKAQAVEEESESLEEDTSAFEKPDINTHLWWSVHKWTALSKSSHVTSSLFIRNKRAHSQFLSLGPNPRYEVPFPGSVPLQTEPQGRVRQNLPPGIGPPTLLQWPTISTNNIILTTVINQHYKSDTSDNWRTNWTLHNSTQYSQCVYCLSVISM